MDEKEAQRQINVIKMLENHLSKIMTEEDTLLATHTSMINASKTIQEMMTTPTAEALLSIGGGVLIPAKIDPDRMVVNIGAGAAVEKKPVAALNHLEARMKEIEMAMRNSAEQKTSISRQIEMARSQVADWFQAASNQAPSRNV